MALSALSILKARWLFDARTPSDAIPPHPFAYRINTLIYKMIFSFDPPMANQKFLQAGRFAQLKVKSFLYHSVVALRLRPRSRAGED
jgi:hypothetical protein